LKPRASPETHPSPPLLHHAIAEVGDAVGLHHAGAFQVELAIPDIGEEGDASAEQDGDEVDVDLVQEACLRALSIPSVTTVLPVPGPTCFSGGL
jgi:hypothetical protein